MFESKQNNNIREFRLWDKINKKMIYPDNEKYKVEINLDGSFSVKVFEKIHSKSNKKIWVEKRQKDFVLMQWTGHTDKNNKKVFEKDVLAQGKFPDDPDDAIFSVVFENGCFRQKYFEWDESLDKPIITKSVIDLLDYIIIGNIYENP